MKRRVNVKLLAYLLGATVLFVLGVHLLHGYQERRNASALLEQAERALEQGEAEKAAGHLRTYLGFVPDDTEALTRYGFLLNQTASRAQTRLQALEVLEQVVRRDPSRHDVRRQIVAIGMHPQVRRFADAREHLEILLRETQSSDGALFHQLAQCCEAEGDFKAAAQGYEKAIAHDPARIESHVALAELCRRRLDNPRRAAQVLDQMVGANPRAFAAYLARGQFFKEQGDDEKAAADIAKARQIAPDDAGVLLAAGRLAISRREQDTARRDLERGLRLHPQQAEFYLALAELETQTQHPAAAVAILRRGVALMPEQTDLLWALASLRLQQGQEPAEEMAQLTRHGLPAAQRDFLQARILMNQGQWLPAARLLEKCQAGLRAWPELSKQADLYLGTCHAQLGNLDQQHAAYSRAVATDPFWEPACLGLAAAQTARGEIDEALATYRRILPRVPSVRLAMARLLVTRNRRLPAEQQRWDEVDRLLNEAGKIVPPSVEVPVLRAEALTARGEFAQAEQLLRQARDAHPRQPEPWIALAAIALQHKQSAAALALLEEAGRKVGDCVELRLARAGYWAEEGGAEASTALQQLGQNIDGFSPEKQKQLLRGLASCHMHRGEMAEAEAVLARLAKQSPGDLNCRLVLFDLALASGREETLHRLLEELKAIEGPDGLHFQYGKACWRIQLGRKGDRAALTEAQTILAQLATLRPTWPRIAASQGEIADFLKDHATAIKCYQKALELGERQPPLVRRLVELLYQQRRYAEADEVIQKLPRHAALPPELGRLAAAISLQRQDPARALQLARRAVSSQSKDYRDYLWLGQFLAATAEKAEAERMLRRAVELAQTVPEPWVALVGHLARTGQKEQAEATLAEAEKKLPREEAAALASCHEALGQFEQARRRYQEALTTRPNDAALLRGLAGFCLRHGPGPDAEQYLRRLIALAPRAPEEAAWARRMLAVRLAASGEYPRWREALTLVGLTEDADPPKTTAENIEDQKARAVVLAVQRRRPQRQRAIALLEELRAKQPLSAEEQYLLTQLYEAGGDWPAARQQMLQLLTAHATNARYIAHYAQTLLRRGEAAEAAIWLGKLEKLAEAAGSFTLVELKARLLAAQHNGNEVVQTLDRYLEQEDPDPRNRAARLLLTAHLLEELYQQSAQPKVRVAYAEAADKLYRRLQELQPERVLDRIAFLTRRGEATQALELCGEAWARCPPPAVGAACLAVLRGTSPSAEQVQQVERWLTDAIRNTEKWAPALRVCLADLRDLQGRYAEAEKLYREVVAEAPGNVVALNNLAYLLALRSNQPGEALELLNRAIALAGPTPELVDTRAVIHLKLGQSGKAIKDLEAALADAPLPTLCYHLAQAHHLARNPTAAREALRKARSLGLQPGQLHALERPAYQQLHAALDSR